MNRLLILLFMVGWAFYIVQVTRPADAVQSEQNAKTSRQAAPGQQAVTQSEIQPIARAEVRLPHAITPDEPPQKAAVSSEAAPPKMLRPAPCRREGGEKGTAGLTLGLLTGHSNRAELGCSKNNPGTLRHRADRGFTVARPGGHPNLNTRQVQKKRSSPAAWLTARHEAGGRGTVL